MFNYLTPKFPGGLRRKKPPRVNLVKAFTAQREFKTPRTTGNRLKVTYKVTEKIFSRMELKEKNQ